MGISPHGLDLVLIPRDMLKTSPTVRTAGTNAPSERAALQQTTFLSGRWSHKPGDVKTDLLRE